MEGSGCFGWAGCVCVCVGEAVIGHREIWELFGVLVEKGLGDAEWFLWYRKEKPPAASQGGGAWCCAYVCVSV